MNHIDLFSSQTYSYMDVNSTRLSIEITGGKLIQENVRVLVHFSYLCLNFWIWSWYAIVDAKISSLFYLSLSYWCCICILFVVLDNGCRYQHTKYHKRKFLLLFHYPLSSHSLMILLDWKNEFVNWSSDAQSVVS